MVGEKDLLALKLELSVKAKNGLDFITSAGLVWAILAFVWTLPYLPQQKAFFTFCLGGLVLPLAWLLSKVFHTTWTFPHNPLQPLGLWLNFAQLFYFPLLMVIYARQPGYFIMSYAIITGAHLFPYAWLYHARVYAVLAGAMAAGSMVLGLRLGSHQAYLIPTFMAGAFTLLGLLLLVAYKRNNVQYLLADAHLLSHKPLDLID
jgi:hypothetical protein